MILSFFKFFFIYDHWADAEDSPPLSLSLLPAVRVEGEVDFPCQVPGPESFRSGPSNFLVRYLP